MRLIHRSDVDDADRSAATGIVVRGVEHEYRGQTGAVRALEPIDLRIEGGEFVVVLGPSGCGKSTLLRILSGLLAPTRGVVQLGNATPEAARRARAIGWLAQEDGLLPWLRVLDNVLLPVRVQRRVRAEDTALAHELLARVGLTGSAGQYPHELSGGMRQRAALARALLARPAFLLLDEPFAHIDELTRERLGELVLELRAATPAPPTTVLVTHSVAEAVRLAERVVVFSARPGGVVLDARIALGRPRRDEQSGFGAQVRALKDVLAEAAPAPPLPLAREPRAAASA